MQPTGYNILEFLTVFILDVRFHVPVSKEEVMKMLGTIYRGMGRASFHLQMQKMVGELQDQA